MSPLCSFCLSPPFSIRPLSRRPENSSSRRRSIRGWRRDGCSLPSVRPRFKPSTRRASNYLLKNLAGILANQRGKTLSLRQVLDIIQKVWRPLQHVESSNSSLTMEEKLRKSSSTSNEIPSPVLLRRRLSAPETIMRKHVLALQRSDSQDSEATQSSDTKSRHWRSEMEAGSDSNLSGKRDSDLMRKSTLLRRLWSNSKPFSSSRFPGTFYEWQHSYGKLSSGRSTHSLTSIHSSPEHLVRSQSKRSLNASPQHKQPLVARKISPKHQSHDVNKNQSPNNINLTPRRKISMYDGNFESYTTSYYSDETVINSNITNSNNRNSTTTVTPKTTDTETSTRTTNTSYTTFSDNSDSAYTNSRSIFSQTSNNNSTTPSEIHKQIIEEAEVSNQDLNQTNLELKSSGAISTVKKLQDSPEYVKYSTSVNESSTQTVEKTNVNVISNVHLSQSTLDLIFNHVMQDVKNSIPSNTSILSETVPVNSESESKLINVQQIPSFYLKQKDDVTDNPQHSRIVKYMISNVGTGSPYSKPAEVPQVVVPRYSALPRTASMEVNISSGDSTDKESDTISLADSLEDSSPRIDSVKIDEKPVTGDLSVLLPDNSVVKQPLSRPTAFFIPIEIKNHAEFKAVSEHLPEKVRNKLARRQQRREEKLQAKSKQSSPRSDSNYVSASDNGNQMHFIVDNSPDINLNNTPNLPQVNYNKSKKRSKPLLPSIKTFRRIKMDKPEGNHEEKTKTIKRKSVSRGSSSENSFNNKTKSNIKSKSQEKLSPVYSTKSEYVYDYDGPKKFYHKTEFNNSNKRIEILEIMECLETSEKLNRQFSRKSRIPVLINKLPRMENQQNRAIKPTFLDLNCAHITDPKFDQLIANILIETLNSPNLEPTVSKSPGQKDKSTDRKPGELQPPTRHSPGSKYQQKFEVIPEELSFQSSNEDAQNNDVHNNNDSKRGNPEESPYKGKAAVAVVRDENFSSIPKGWITFYMLHKNGGSPDSTSDEGKKSDNANTKTNQRNAKKFDKNPESNDEGLELKRVSENESTSPTNNNTYIVKKENCCLSETNDNFSSSSEMRTKGVLSPPNLNGRHKKHNYQRKQRFKSSGDTEKCKEFGEWSVTVSGTNTYGQFAPDLEMCLKFPDSHKGYSCPSQSDSGLGEENEKKLHFPKIDSKVCKYKKIEEEGENVYLKQRLPDIGRSKSVKKQRKSDPSISPISAIIPSKIEPRQTRTSLRRYNLTRPKIEYQSPETPRSTFNLFDERHYAEFLRHLPEILTITGNAINKDKNKDPYN